VKYYVKLFPRLDTFKGNSSWVRACADQRTELRKAGYVVEWAELYESWCAEFDTEEEAAIFKLTHI
jgi:hypothetical protein